MKSWGLNRWGALLAVLLLLVSAALVLPPGAHAQGKTVWGRVSDCADTDSVGALVSLVDVQGRAPDVTVTAPGDTGFFSFQPQPGYYKFKVQPTGFTHFPTETTPFRFDGTVSINREVCVDEMPTKDRWLNLTVLDGQAFAVAGEAVTFVEVSRGPENATQPLNVRFERTTGVVRLDTFPLKWNSERLLWVDDADPLGTTLAYGAHYTYNQTGAFAGRIRITDSGVWGKLNNTLTGGSPRGFLTTQYTNVSQSSSLRNGHVATVTFHKNAVSMGDISATLEFTPATGAIRIIGNWSFGVDALTADYTWRATVVGASVTMIDVARGEPIAATAPTDAGGKVSFRVWNGGTFDVKVVALGFQPYVATFTVNADTSADVLVPRARGVSAVVATVDGDEVRASDGLTGILISTGAVNPELRILIGTVSDNLVRFNAYDGTFLLMVDADGFCANSQVLILSGANRTLLVALSECPDELHTTTVVFNNNDWNDVSVYRNLTLLEDSALPAIEHGNLRNLRRQLDLVFGNGDGILDSGELAIVRTYLVSAGPFYTTTDAFFTVNGKTYRSRTTATDHTVTVTDGPGTNFTISARTNYQLSDPTKPIPLNQAKYFVNVTTIADKLGAFHQNYTFFVKLPRGYEMTSRTLTGNVTTRGFVNVEIDPGVDATNPNPRANLIVERSLTGVARAEVEGPIGKVSVREADQAKYLAWVANDTAIVFSANKTTDRSNQAINVKDANFTWRFTNGTLPNDVGYGIWTTFNYDNNGGEFVVNLTVTQVNPDNRTWRDIRVAVDTAQPVAVLKTNRTTGDNPASLTVNEDIPIFFDGRNSSDLLFGSVAGKVAEWNWDFDADGTVDRTGSTVNWNYSKPGVYTAILYVVDSVGHRSDNRTMAVTVRDVTPPAVNIAILDPENNWREASQLQENKVYYLNASRTTDNSLNATEDNVNLTYRWQFGDATAEQSAVGLLNVSHTYARFGQNYKLNVSARDASGNVGWLNRTLVVAANVTAHPDISIISGTLKITPSSPEEGQRVTFRINITNEKDRATATDLRVQFALIEGGKDKNQSISALKFLDPNGNEITELASGQNATVEFRWAAPTLGNKTLKIKVWDADEPDTLITGANQVSSNLLVREAGWKFWAIVGGFLFIVFGLPIIYYVVRKVRAGEMTLPRRRRKEEEEEEEEEEDEGGPRKKRL